MPGILAQRREIALKFYKMILQKLLRKRQEKELWREHHLREAVLNAEYRQRWTAVAEAARFTAMRRQKVEEALCWQEHREWQDQLDDELMESLEHREDVMVIRRVSA